MNNKNYIHIIINNNLIKKEKKIITHIFIIKKFKLYETFSFIKRKISSWFPY